MVMERDRSCRITGYQEGREVAHLVPREKRIWFVNNNMTRYSSSAAAAQSPVNDVLNAVLLRTDLHQLFDRRRFAFVPKGSPSRLVVHQILPSPSREMHYLYHNRGLQRGTCGIAPQFLFARFAWTVLCDESYTFLKGPQRYAVKLWDPEKGETTVRTLRSGDVAVASRIFDAPAEARSVSPWKRELCDPGEGEEGDDYGDEEDDGDDNGHAYVGIDTSEDRSRWWSNIARGPEYDTTSEEEEDAHLNDSLSTISTLSGDYSEASAAYRKSYTSAKEEAAVDIPARKRKRVS